MIDTLKIFNDELEDFLKLHIQFNTEYNKYIFKGKWTSEINEAYFDNRIDTLKNLLYNQLREGKRNDLFLNQTLMLVREKFDFYHDYDYGNFSFLRQSGTIIRKYHNAKADPPKEQFNYNYFIENSKEDFFLTEEYKDFNDESRYRYLYFQEIFNKNLATENEFEEHKLMYCIIMFVDKIFILQNFIENLIEDYEMIDFSLINIDIKIPVSVKKVKCKINLNKKSVAEIVAFLINDGVLFLDQIDPKNNKVLIQNFIQDNFTFKLSNGMQTDINTLTREISETHFDQKEKYNAYIDKLIEMLQSKKIGS